VRPAVEYRKIPAVTALAVAQVVSAADLATWGSDALGALSDALAAAGVAPAGASGASGPFGALFPGDFFELERSEITAFVPVGSPPAGFGPLDGLPGGQVRLLEIPAVEAAIAVHEGPLDDIDRTYGALGTVVAERAIGVDGPIREYYLIGFPETEDESKHRTEVAWPVFLTG
jgi:effector-binding domain-containing protein